MNLYIDGHAFMNVTANVVKSQLTNKPANQSKDVEYWTYNIVEERHELKIYTKNLFRDFVVNYMSSIVTPLKDHLDEVFLVFDKKSWRYDEMERFYDRCEDVASERETLFPEPKDYKEGRKKDEHEHLLFDFFREEIAPYFEENLNMKIIQTDGAEGDDCIAYLIDKYKDSDSIIWSVDQDFKQCVETTDRFVILLVPKQMFKHKRMFTTGEMNDILIKDSAAKASSIDDLFELDDSVFTEDTRESILTILAQKQYFQYEIDPVEALLTKLLGGDKKDAIDRVYKMTAGKVNKTIAAIFEQYNKDEVLEKIDSSDEEFIDFVVDKMAELNKIEDEKLIEDIREHFIFNILVIRLHPNFIPDAVKESLENQIADEIENKSNFKYTRFASIKEQIKMKQYND